MIWKPWKKYYKKKLEFEILFFIEDELKKEPHRSGGFAPLNEFKFLPHPIGGEFEILFFIGDELKKEPHRSGGEAPLNELKFLPHPLGLNLKSYFL